MKTSFKIRTDEGWLLEISKRGLMVYFYDEFQHADFMKKYEDDVLILRKKIREYFKSKNIKTKLFREK